VHERRGRAAGTFGAVGLCADIDGFAVAAALAAQGEPPAVVLVSSRSRTDYGPRVGDSCARGFIAKAELTGDAVRRLLADLPCG
jgi:hypothetical protein